jgi:group I intron endonuclease
MIVYLITNRVNGKQYVGQTVQTLKQRWDKHNVNDNCPAMAKAIKKYGRESFDIETLHTCETKEEMDFVEIFYISLLSTKPPYGYNLTDGGDGAAGFKMPDSAKEKLRILATGRVASEETRKKMSISHKGQKRTEEARRNISLAKLGNTSRLGRKHSEETKQKMSLAQKGKAKPWMVERNKTEWMRAAASKPKPPKTEEQRKKISTARSGKHYPKLSEALRKKPRPRSPLTGRFLNA